MRYHTHTHVHTHIHTHTYCTHTHRNLTYHSIAIVLETRRKADCEEGMNRSSSHYPFLLTETSSHTTLMLVIATKIEAIEQ